MSATNNLKKTIKKNRWTYFGLTLVTLVIAKVYGLFGHGVTSPAMTWMFLFPLIGGVVGYSFIKPLLPKNVTAMDFRSFSNLYNSGIATLSVGSFLQSILEIAGTNSVYVPYFYLSGAVLLAVGLSLLLPGWAKKHPEQNRD